MNAHGYITSLAKRFESEGVNLTSATTMLGFAPGCQPGEHANPSNDSSSDESDGSRNDSSESDDERGETNRVDTKSPTAMQPQEKDNLALMFGETLAASVPVRPGPAKTPSKRSKKRRRGQTLVSIESGSGTGKTKKGKSPPTVTSEGKVVGIEGFEDGNTALGSCGASHRSFKAQFKLKTSHEGSENLTCLFTLDTAAGLNYIVYALAYQIQRFCPNSVVEQYSHKKPLLTFAADGSEMKRAGVITLKYHVLDTDGNLQEIQTTFEILDKCVLIAIIGISEQSKWRAMLDIHDIKTNANMPQETVIIREPNSYKLPLYRNVNAVFATNVMCEKKEPEQRSHINSQGTLCCTEPYGKCSEKFADMVCLDSILLDKGIARGKDLMKSIPDEIHVTYNDAVIAFDSNNNKSSLLGVEVRKARRRNFKETTPMEDGQLPVHTVNDLTACFLNGSMTKSVDGDVIAHLGDDDHVNVYVDGEVDFEDLSQFQPLTDYMCINEILGASVEEQTKTEVPVPMPKIKKIGTWTEASVHAALKHALENKEVPPYIEYGSEFHIEFLYRHFCRLAPKQRVKDTKMKAKWKAAIKANLGVFDDTIGCMKAGPYSFSLVEGYKPVNCKPYPLSPIKKDALSKMIKVLLENDIIERSNTAEWNSPVLLVSKGDGRWRLVVDYRRVNMLIANAPVVYPRPQDLFETVRDAYFMFLIDGRDFYFQREIAEELRDMTTFKTHILAYRFKRMPQGLKPSSAAAINPVTDLLSDHLHEWMLLHCDDCLGWAKTEEASLERFTWVIEKFRTFGMTLGWFKVWILLEKAEYVSHIIDRGRVYPNQKMVSVIDAIPPPATVKLVQTFVGMCGYFELYMPMLAHHRAVLTALTKDDVEFKWTEVQQTAFVAIKGLLKSACLYIVDWDLPMYLITDASGTALGGALLQKHKGFYHPIRFMSRSLDKFERNQENREREMRAGLYCMIKCHSLLSHHPFTWCTDHANIDFIMRARCEHQRIARLALWLSSYSYNLQHLAGKHILMQIADALSRLLIDTGEDKDIFVPFDGKQVQHQLLAAISKDKILKSPAESLLSKDTIAKMTRVSVETVPRNQLMVITDNSTYKDHPRVCFDVVAKASKEHLLATEGAKMNGHSPMHFALDVNSLAGEGIKALSLAGFVVNGSVGLDPLLHQHFLNKYDGLAVYDNAISLANALVQKKVQMPHISFIQTKISKSAKTPSHVMPSVECNLLEGLLAIVRSLNQVQKPYVVPLIHLWYLDKKKLIAIDSYERVISDMGYILTKSHVHTGKYGDAIGANVALVVLSRSTFPLVQPVDTLSAVSDFLGEDSSPGYIRHLYQAKIVKKAPVMTGVLIKDKSKFMVPHRESDQGHVPVVAVVDFSTKYYCSGGTIPYPSERLTHILTLGPNAEDNFRKWKHKQLTDLEMLKIFGIASEIKVLSHLRQPVLIHMLKRTMPPKTLLIHNRAALAFILSAANVTDSLAALSKVGGRFPWNTESATTLFRNGIPAGTGGVDGVTETDIVIQGSDAIAALKTEMSRLKRPIKNDQIPTKVKINIYEFTFEDSPKMMSKMPTQSKGIVVQFQKAKAKSPKKRAAVVYLVRRKLLTTQTARSLFEEHGVPQYLHFAPMQDTTKTGFEIKTQLKMFKEVIETAKTINSQVMFSVVAYNSSKYRGYSQVKQLRKLGVVKKLRLRNFQKSFSGRQLLWITNVLKWKLPRDQGSSQSTIGLNREGSYPYSLSKSIYACVESTIADDVKRDVRKVRFRADYAAAVTRLASKVKEAGNIDGNSSCAKKAKTQRNSSVHGKSKGKATSERTRQLGSNSNQRSGGTSGHTPLITDSSTEIEDSRRYFVTKKEILHAQNNDVLLAACRRVAKIRTLIDKLEADDDIVDKQEKEKQLQKLQDAYTTNLQLMSTAVEKTTKVASTIPLRLKSVQGNAQHMFIDENDIMVYATANGQFPVPVLTSVLGEKILLLAHDSLTSVHLGGRKMLHWIRMRYWWFGMSQQIQKHTKTCLICQKMKFASSPGYGFMQMRCYDRPGRCICIDIVVLNHATSLGTKHLFTILDCFSHWADAIPMVEMKASDCAACLLKWCQYNGVPEEVRSDGGLNLNPSEIFKSLYEIFGIGGITGHPYSPQSNTVERFHRWLGAALRILYYEKDLDVDESLPIVLWIFRATENRATGFTPFMLHQGREVRFPLDVFENDVAEVNSNEFVAHMERVFKLVWAKARVAQQITQEESAHYYNLKHGLLRKFEQGQKVFKKKLPRYNGEISTHMLPQCEGPFQILRVSTKGALLKHCTTGKESHHTLRQLKPIYLREDDDHFEENGDTIFRSGQLVAVRIKGTLRKWQIAQLLHTTADQDSWEVQWFNTPDKTGPMLDKRYLPAWLMPSGQESLAEHGKQKEDWSPITWRAYKRRFVTPQFKLKHFKLPQSIKSLLRSKFGNQNETLK